MQEFRDRIESGDFVGAGELFAEDAVFRSPATFKPYRGKPLVSAIIRGVGRVFGELRYVRELTDDNGSVLVFETSIGDTSVTGIDLITTNDDGLITELAVLVRPLSALTALAEGMNAEFPRILQEATAAAEAPTA